MHCHVEVICFVSVYVFEYVTPSLTQPLSENIFEAHNQPVPIVGWPNILSLGGIPFTSTMSLMRIHMSTLSTNIKYYHFNYIQDWFRTGYYPGRRKIIFKCPAE